MKPIWTEGAVSDWEGIARYIAVNFGKKAFDEFDKKTDEEERQIADFPGSGTPLKTRKHCNLGLKFVFIGKLSKMIYHVVDETVFVDVIWDTRQSPKRLADRLSKL
jgi:plasmid stabilization system protein ParE